MRYRFALLVMFAMSLMGRGSLPAQEQQNPRMLMEQIRWIEYQIVGGRIVAQSPYQDRSTTATAAHEGRNERLTVDLADGRPNLLYELNAPTAQLTIRVVHGTTLHFSRLTRRNGIESRIVFDQPEEGSVRLTVDREKVNDGQEINGRPQGDAPAAPPAAQEPAAQKPTAQENSEPKQRRDASKSEVKDEGDADPNDAQPSDAPAETLGHWQIDGPTIWHLMLLDPKLCAEHLVPLLQYANPAWRLEAIAIDIEQGLLQAAQFGPSNQRGRWTDLVNQLADDAFSTREAAQRQLLQCGPSVLPFLQKLDRRTLDADQRHRIRQIVRDLSQNQGDDNARRVVAWLVADACAWSSLLGRDEPSVRQLAHEHLQRITDRTITFDSAAEPIIRQQQWSIIREDCCADVNR